MTRERTARIGVIAAIVVAGSGFGACSGPVPLSRAIWPLHDQEFRRLLAMYPVSPRQAWYAWNAQQHDITIGEAQRRDQALSTARNPFDANREPEAVSRGAVTYRAYCQRCHGQDARGDGSDLLPGHVPRDMHAFPQRFAVTLHKGAPRTWFRKINAGFGDVVNYPDGPSSAMPAFGDTLAREQIWLVITYLQSLDVYHQPAPAPLTTPS